jgi:hypothetical protein
MFPSQVQKWELTALNDILEKIPHRIKPTSTFRRSARRPNPGRGSPYRRGIASVKCTARTSPERPMPSAASVSATIGKDLTNLYSYSPANASAPSCRFTWFREQNGLVTSYRPPIPTSRSNARADWRPNIIHSSLRRCAGRRKVDRNGLRQHDQDDRVAFRGALLNDQAAGTDKRITDLSSSSRAKMGSSSVMFETSSRATKPGSFSTGELLSKLSHTASSTALPTKWATS